MTDTQVEAANIVAAWLAALSTGTDIKTVDTVVLRKRIAAALDASNNEIACLKNKIVELEANTASLLDAREREVWLEAAKQCEKGVYVWCDINNGKADALQEFADWCRRQGGGG